MKRGLSTPSLILIIIFLVIVVMGTALIVKNNSTENLQEVGKSSTKNSQESVKEISENPNEQGQGCVSFCNPAPEGCFYDYSDDRYTTSTNPDDYEDYYASPRKNVYTSCLLYPCGVLTCEDLSITCTKGGVNEATIQLGETKVVTGLPIQLGFISKITGSLSGTLVYGSGLFSSIYGDSLPQFSLVEIYDGKEIVTNYSVEKVSLTDTSVTLKVYCGEEEYFESLPPLKCTDSDSGKDYYVKGITASGRYDVEGGTEDVCITDDRLFWLKEGSMIEYFCDENNSTEGEVYECPNGCQDGACIA